MGVVFTLGTCDWVKGDCSRSQLCWHLLRGSADGGVELGGKASFGMDRNMGWSL